MKKKVVLLLSVLMIIVAIVGCSGEKITEGEVIKKEFTPAYTTTRMIPVVHRVGNTSWTQLIPYTYHYNNKWEITIQQYDEEKQEMLYATYSVTEEVYNFVEIGYEFVYENNMEPTEPEYTREKE